MAKDTGKTPETTNGEVSVWLAVWRDNTGKPHAFGIDADKTSAKKKADKDRLRFEKKDAEVAKNSKPPRDGIELERQTVQVVKLS